MMTTKIIRNTIQDKHIYLFLFFILLTAEHIQSQSLEPTPFYVKNFYGQTSWMGLELSNGNRLGVMHRSDQDNVNKIGFVDGDGNWLMYNVFQEKKTYFNGKIQVNDNFNSDSNGVEFRHTNNTQGIGFGYNTIYATGSNESQPLGLKSRGSGDIIFDPQQGKVRFGSDLTVSPKDLTFYSHLDKVTFNTKIVSDTLRFSMNTDAKVENAVATIAGAVYIGSINEKAKAGTDPTPDKFDKKYLRDYNLWVEDGIVTEDIAIISVNEWKDNVFKEEYRLKSLEELESYIKANKHLPGVKSEAEVKKEGYSIQEMDVALLEKVEELTLYTIEQEKKIRELTEKLTVYQKMESEIKKIKQFLKIDSSKKQ